ncbi:MAG: hypothetical protein PHE50_07055 [Dehalococcoidales bacterium]|nr:hypothetical protein [Dehalococcoidales bacterium]
MEILVCDRCGFELTDQDAILLALEGTDSWQNSCRGLGEEPRGVFPCKYFRNCRGQMQLLNPKKKKK